MVFDTEANGTAYVQSQRAQAGPESSATRGLRPLGLRGLRQDDRNGAGGGEHPARDGGGAGAGEDDRDDEECYWADFTNPSSGTPRFSSLTNTNHMLFENIEYYKQLGF